jgi:hypothetical protein
MHYNKTVEFIKLAQATDYRQSLLIKKEPNIKYA